MNFIFGRASFVLLLSIRLKLRASDRKKAKLRKSSLSHGLRTSKKLTDACKFKVRIAVFSYEKQFLLKLRASN